MPNPFDEFEIEDERPRHNWRPLWEELQSLPASRLTARERQMHRRLNEQEVTYTVHGKGESEERLWDLDLLPALMDGAEWDVLSHGLRQRMRAIEALVADCYGPRSLLASGVLPAQLLYEHPGYIRPSIGQNPAGGSWLHLYACDLVRGADGIWRVMADRCQSPLGLGYALENRFVVARSWPALFRRERVKKLNDGLMRLRRALMRVAPTEDGHARTAILSSDVYGDNRFEQAYLARYLGIDLVESLDLTVRGNHLYRKTIAGLEPVHTLLRYVDDAWCDPVTLRPDSLVGVPGLLDCVAAGTVAVVNGIGTGIAESPALRPMIGGLMPTLIGEDPLLQSLPTLWGGECGVDELLKQDILKNTWDPLRRRIRMRDNGYDDEFVKIVEKNPEAWCGEAALDASRVPVWRGGVLERATWSIRAFVIRDEDGLHVLPGGLARVSNHADDLHNGTRLGGGTKDCWVLGGDEEDEPKLPRMPAAPESLVRGGVARTSRRLDDLFWMARGAERVECLARSLRCAVEIEERFLAQEIDSRVPQVDDILTKAGVKMPPEDRFRPAALVAAVDGPLSLECQAVHRLAMNCRNLVSQGTLSTVHELVHLTAESNASLRLATLKPLLDRLVHVCLALAGSAYENTVRDWAWSFIEMGRRLERAMQLVTWARAFLRANDRELTWHLTLADSLLTYRARYLDRIDATSVHDTLLADETNPRALQFQIDNLLATMVQLPVPGADGGQRVHDMRQSLERAMGQLTLEDISDDSLEKMEEALAVAGEAIDHIWFSHSAEPRAVNRTFTMPLEIFR